MPDELKKTVVGTLANPGPYAANGTNELAPYEADKQVPSLAFCGIRIAPNPKHVQAQKDGKAPMEYLCYGVLGAEAKVLKHGADKYGVHNWRVDKILASTYVAAIMRHLVEWEQGADADKDSGEHPLVHIRACCAVALDAIKHGTLIDDRNRKESKQ
jgi:hypothetical protein